MRISEVCYNYGQTKINNYQLFIGGSQEPGIEEQSGQSGREISSSHCEDGKRLKLWKWKN